MRAVHFVRSRQEERELAWWLSFAAYDLRDRTLNNRIYLLYLIVFFSVWTFVTLTLFAGGGAYLLNLINPDNPGGAAIFLMTVLFSFWMVYGIWRSQRRSPVVFSEQDGYLICQTPVNRREVTFRWLLMPWLKSAVPFWLLAVALGFSIAEVVMPGPRSANGLFVYIGFGFRAWMIFLPVHLGLYSLQWAAGIFRVRVSGEQRWLAWVVIPVSILFFSFLSIITFGSAMVIPSQVEFSPYAGILSWGSGSSLLRSMSGLLPLWIIAFAAVGLIVLVSGGFALSRAAEETREAELISSAYQYGFAAYAEQLRSEQRLRGAHAPSRLPAPAGAGMLVWKDMLQSLRSLGLGSVLRWGWIFAITVTYPILPDPSSRGLTAVFWMIQIGQLAVLRLRGDLSRWALVRQLAIPAREFVLFELTPAYTLSVVVSLFGFVLGAARFRPGIDKMVLLVPGIAATIAGMAAFDVIRRSHSDTLLAGLAPEVSAGGMILALIAGVIPWLIATFFPGWMGLLIAVLVSFGLGISAINLAVYAFRKIDRT